MRVLAAMLLGMSLAAAPLMANDAKDAGKEESPAKAVAEKPRDRAPLGASESNETAKSENAIIESELQDLRSLVQSQIQELESQRAALKAQQLKMESLEERLHVTPSEPVNAPVAVPAAISAATPATAIGATPRTLSTAAAMPAQEKTEEKPSPLFFKIGTAEFYPLGFMDATSIFRTTNMTTQGGGSIGTSFGGIPFNNTIPGRNTEEKFSAQNSRIGLRVHSKVGAADMTGYLEADFLGYLAPSGNVTSNSDSLRLRLYWADYKRGKFEVLGGQSWSLLTPNRNGLSAIPGDLFIGQEMDTNYFLGLTYTRATGIRFLLHPTNNWAIGVSLENPQQLLPSTVILPSTVPAAGQGNNYGGQFDSNSGNTSSAVGVNNTSIPNLAPDVIVKTAFDAVPGGHHVHFDLAGIMRTFKAVNLVSSVVTSSTDGLTPSNTNYSTIHGGGAAATLNVELIKNFRLISTGYYSYAGGRYIANTAGPDLIVKPDGTLSGIHSGSGLAGFEYQVNPKFLFYGYYSAAYFGRNVGQVVTTAGGVNTTTNSGYGFYPGTVATGGVVAGSTPGSNNSSNRYLFEPTFGVVHTMWRNPSYGDLKVITQYSYVSRTPWYVPAGAPATAHTSMVYVDLRYDLP